MEFIHIDLDHLAVLNVLETFSDQCDYIQKLLNVEYPFKAEDQPEAWVQRLILSKNSNSKGILSLIRKMFGGNINCSEASEVCGYPIDLIEQLGMMLDEIQDIYIDDRNEVEIKILEIIIDLRFV